MAALVTVLVVLAVLALLGLALSVRMRAADARDDGTPAARRD